MCGIFGFSFEDDQNDQLLLKMGDLQYHRGPDGSAYYRDKNISLGMRRLSIIDIKYGSVFIISNTRI